MEINRFTLKRESPGPITISLLGDIHHGTTACDDKLFTRTMQAITRRQHYYWFTIGDNIEAIHEKDSRYNKLLVLPEYQDNRDTIVDQQLDGFVERTKSAAYCCLGIGLGNHEQTLIAAQHTNPASRIAKMLGVKYLGAEGLLILRCEAAGSEMLVKILYRHGFQRAGSVQTSLRRMKNALSVYNYDVAVAGHIHQNGHEDFEQLDLIGNQYTARRKHVIVVSGFRKSKMRGVDDYTDQCADVIDPTPLRVPAIEIWPERQAVYYIPEIK